jgi:hypothetical protein
MGKRIRLSIEKMVFKRGELDNKLFLCFELTLKYKKKH